MPGLRFSCDQWFETTLESQHVPRIGERVVLSEHGQKVNYRVTDVTWNLAEGEEHGAIEIDVDRELQNPCTKCRQFHWKLRQIYEFEPVICPATIAWECEACEYARFHEGRPMPVPPRIVDTGKPLF